MQSEHPIINLKKDIEDRYKHLENNITERTVFISEKDIEIFKDILKRNCGGWYGPSPEMRSIFSLVKQVIKTNESDS